MQHSKATLFLMELIIAILFFSLASTVCIQLFAKSHLLGEKTINQNQAVIWAQNLAEGYLAMEGDLEKLETLFEYGTYLENTDSLLLAFDSNWNGCLDTEASYLAKLTSYPINETGLIHADIVVYATTDEENPIYTLTISHHIAERRGSIE